ncbi:unnamed protein product [Phaeothamnion confervicola]
MMLPRRQRPRFTTCILAVLCLLHVNPASSFHGTELLLRRQQWAISSSRSAPISAIASDLSTVVTPLLPSPKVGRIVAIVPGDELSSFEHRGSYATWLEVFEQVGRRVGWTSDACEMRVVTAEAVTAGEASLNAANVLFAIKILDADTATAVAEAAMAAAIPTRVALDCANSLQRITKLGSFRPFSWGGGYQPTAEDGHCSVADDAVVAATTPFAVLATKVSGGTPLVETLPDPLRRLLQGGGKRERTAWSTVLRFYERMTAEDLVFLLLTLVDKFVAPVPQVTGIGRAYGLKEVKCMCTKCTKQMIDCFGDPECRACINCLEACPPNDQVCAYRCITSYETPKMEAFSRCILQKHNCLGNTAVIPAVPDPPPLVAFRGRPLTFAAAEDLFIGWLGPLQSSWKVVCGQNPAYDYFPSQHMIFFRGRGRGTFWYDPVFKVFTLDGRAVWRRRHYRVRAAETPGTFRFSVLDNGVTSNEYWRIVDVAEDLSWGVFYYAGAAAAAGQAYAGALLVTPDGSWPSDDRMPAVRAAFARCDIRMWELSEVDNSDSAGAPLGLPADYIAANNRNVLV